MRLLLKPCWPEGLGGVLCGTGWEVLAWKRGMRHMDMGPGQDGVGVSLGCIKDAPYGLRPRLRIKDVLFLVMCVFAWVCMCACQWVWAHEYGCLHKPEELDSHGAGCEPHPR